MKAASEQGRAQGARRVAASVARERRRAGLSSPLFEAMWERLDADLLVELEALALQKQRAREALLRERKASKIARLEAASETKQEGGR